MRIVRLLIALAALLLATDTSASVFADKCAGAKLKAVGKKEAGLLGCQSEVAAINNASGLAACETKVKGKFSAAFGKAGVCIGDEMACEDVADGCESSVAGAFIDTFPSSCEAAKRKAAGKLAKGELGCYSKAAAKGLPVDTASCIPKAQGKFSDALTRAGTCPDGGTPQTLVENKCVKPAVTTDAGGIVTDICPTTTPVLCGASPFPMCGGPCPSFYICMPQTTTCMCVPVPPPCGLEGEPCCGGLTCGTGCCSAGVCAAGTSNTACGMGGTGACVSCASSAAGMVCISSTSGGTCGCNTLADCPPGATSCTGNTCM